MSIYNNMMTFCRTYGVFILTELHNYIQNLLVLNKGFFSLIIFGPIQYVLPIQLLWA